MTVLDEVPQGGLDEQTESVSGDLDTPVTAHRSCPGRTVFTEDGNTDGWIATDLTVTPER